MAENNVLNGIEIPSELLDGIAGGVLTDTSKEFLRVLITSAKKGGYTMENFVEDLVSFSAIEEFSLLDGKRVKPCVVIGEVVDVEFSCLHVSEGTFDAK